MLNQGQNKCIKELHGNNIMIIESAFHTLNSSKKINDRREVIVENIAVAWGHVRGKNTHPSIHPSIHQQMQNQYRLLSNLKRKTNKLFRIPLAPINVQSQTVLVTHTNRKTYRHTYINKCKIKVGYYQISKAKLTNYSKNH